jgi:hypothetical protein
VHAALKVDLQAIGAVDLNGDSVREEHSSREVYYGATGTAEP